MVARLGTRHVAMCQLTTHYIEQLILVYVHMYNMYVYISWSYPRTNAIYINLYFVQTKNMFWTWRLQRAEDPMKPMRLSNFGSLKAQFRAKWFKPQMDRWSKKKIKKVRLVLLTKSLSSFVFF